MDLLGRKGGSIRARGWIYQSEGVDLSERGGRFIRARVDLLGQRMDLLGREVGSIRATELLRNHDKYF